MAMPNLVQIRPRGFSRQMGGLQDKCNLSIITTSATIVTVTGDVRPRAMSIDMISEDQKYSKVQISVPLDPLTGGEVARCPFSKNHKPALGPLGFFVSQV